MDQIAPVTTQTPTAPPVAAPSSEPVIAPAPDSLAEFRAQKAAALKGETPAPEPVAAAPTQEPSEPVEAPEQPAQPTTTKGLEQNAAQRWVDPETGQVLDLRRKDHRRWKQTFEERQQYAREVEQLRRDLQQFQQRPPEPPQPAARPAVPRVDPQDPEPTLEQFADQPDPYGAYVAATSRWHARQEATRIHSERAAVERTQRTAAAIDSAQARFDAGLDTARSRYPDFDAVHADLLTSLARTPAPVRAPIIHRLLTSPQGHDLAHYLGTHPDAVQRLVTARSPREQQFALGEIAGEMRVAQTPSRPAQPITAPAAPIAPVAGGASASPLPDPSKMTLAQFRANKPKFGMRA